MHGLRASGRVCMCVLGREGEMCCGSAVLAIATEHTVKIIGPAEGVLLLC